MKELVKLLSQWCKLDYVLVFTCAILIMSRNIFCLEATDMNVHLSFSEEFLKTHLVPFPPLYFLVVAVVSKLLPFSNALEIAGVLLLALAILMKYALSKKFLGIERYGFKQLMGLLGWLLLALMLFFPLYLPWTDQGIWYMGKFTPTIWHNSTTIAVLPFCLLLFNHSILWLDKPLAKYWFYMLFLGLLIALTKPSFLFAFIPAFPLITLFQQKSIDQRVVKSGVLSLIFLFFIAGMGFLIFSSNSRFDDYITTPAKDTTIILTPLTVWRAMATHKISAILTSFTFPALALVVFRTEITKDIQLLFSIFIGFFSVLVFLLFAESGERLLHGNLYWQVPISYFIFNLIILNKLLKEIYASGNLKSLHKPMFFLVILFLFYGVSGFFYLLNYMIFDTYA